MHKEQIKNILIINLGGIGDVLLSTPSLKAIRNLYPHAEISMMAIPAVCGMIKELPYLNNVYDFAMGNERDVSVFRELNNLKTLLDLRMRHFDLAINMRTLVSEKSARKMKFLLNVIKPKMKVGRDTEGRGYFFDIKIPEPDTGKKFEMEYDIATVKALGGDVQDKHIHFAVSNRSTEKINHISRSKGIDEKDVLICVHPGGKPSHRWPVENFSKVMSEISGKISCKFLITGDKDETALSEKIMNDNNHNVIDLAGKLNINELGALMERCSLFICNDTGPMHIAAILKTPVVAIFGPGYFERYNPNSISDKAISLYKRVHCAPCNKVTCDSLECLREISPAEVTEAALKLITNELC